MATVKSNKMYKAISRYVDLRYVLRFTAILIVFHYIDVAFVAIVDPHNFYSPFIDRYLNYVSWLEKSILNTSNLLAHLFGLDSAVHANIIKVSGGSSVILNRPCMGIAIMCFWIAFIFAHKNHFRIKLRWACIGVFTIWFINCLRISLLLLALEHKWQVNKYINHHDLFNYIAYTIIILLICFFYRKNSKETAYRLA